jgi:hypothetical protein
MVHRLVFGLAITAGALIGQHSAGSTRIDFRNFTYPFPTVPRSSVPADRVIWMTLDAKSTITLSGGLYEFDDKNPSISPSVTLDEVRYGNLRMTGRLDAMVVLGYHTGGSANWNYVYAFGLDQGKPTLLGWFQTGDRAVSGLYHLFVSNGAFYLDLFNPNDREADCCSSGFVRTGYEWKGNKFVLAGPPKYGRVEDEPKLRSARQTRAPE